MMQHYEHYSMIIEWSDEDEAYIVTVPELPGCVTHGATYEAAVRQGQDAIDGWIDAQLAHDDPIPPPRTYAAKQRAWRTDSPVIWAGNDSGSFPLTAGCYMWTITVVPRGAHW